MIETSWLTKHERGVLQAALANYRTAQHKKSQVAATVKTRAIAGANAHTASDILRQLAGR